MKAVRFCLVLLLCFCLILSKPFLALANPVISSDLLDSQVASDSDAMVAYSIGTGSNADPYGLMTMDLIDDNYGIAPASSIGSVTNTITNPITVIGYYTNGEGVFTSLRHVVDLSGGSYRVRILDSGLGSQYDGFLLKTVEVWFNKSNLPNPGSYAFSFDFSSDFTIGNVLAASFYSSKQYVNASTQSDYMDIRSGLNLLYGDMYLPPKNISLTSVNNAALVFDFSLADGYRNFSGDFRFNFTPIASGDYPSTAGTDTSQQDYQSGVSNTLNQIDDSLRNLIQHISDQLAALWDQMYNLMHEPTMAKLEEILAVLRAIGNNSDIYAVVEEVRDANRKEIANDNANTGKVEHAVEKHGNFIIEGLKGLFIPSDEYFSTVFNDLNDFFKDKFGFLYTPVDLLIRFINLFSSANAEFTGIPFPELSWDGCVLLEAQTVQFDMLQLDAFKNVQQKLYFLTDLMMIGALLALIHRKFEEVMQN